MSLQPGKVSIKVMQRSWICRVNLSRRSIARLVASARDGRGGRLDRRFDFISLLGEGQGNSFAAAGRGITDARVDQ